MTNTSIVTPIGARVNHAHAPLSEEEVALETLHRRLGELARKRLRIGIWECDLATEELRWTPGVYDMFDLPRGSHVERADTVDMYTPESRAMMQQLRAQALAEQRGFALDAEIISAHGVRRWMRLTAEVACRDGKPVRLFGAKQDITAEVEWRTAASRRRAISMPR